MDEDGGVDDEVEVFADSVAEPGAGLAMAVVATAGVDGDDC